VALALAFPTPGWAALAWLAPAGMLLAALDAPPRRAFGLGYLAGLAHHLVGLRWLLHIPFPAGAVAGWLALSAYLALYQAGWVWLCWHALPAAPAEPEREPGREVEAAWAGDGPPAWWKACARVADLAWSQRAVWALYCAAAWAAMEMLAAHVLTGFPWNPLGVSQYRLLPLIQLAAATGVPGVSFLVAWTAVSLLGAGLVLAARVAADSGWPARSRARPPGPVRWPGAGRLRGTFRVGLLGEVGLPLLALFGVAAWGAGRLVETPPAARELKLALVQPSIPQRLIWDQRESTNRFAQILALTRLALETRPDLVVWPEAALPALAEADYRALSELIATHRVWMVLGADDAEPRPEGGHDFYNSAVLFGPDGGYRASYRKQRLVIFGEYVPFERWLPVLKRLTPIEGSFTPGPGPVTFVLTNPLARLAPLICFEDVFARGVRRHVGPDTDFLLNLTNDGWFGESAAQWQQAVHAAFRAVETGLPLVRCTNNGLTCWVDAQGRFRAVLGWPGGNLYGPGFLQVRLPLPPAGTMRTPTPYLRYGDWFGWGCAGVTLAAWAARGCFRRHPAGCGLPRVGGVRRVLTAGKANKDQETT
jgi:apolipoprotein N-acyltransferase